MTDLEALTELAKDCGLDALVSISTARGNPAVLIEPSPETSPNVVLSLLEALCKEISFTVPSIRYAIVDLGDSRPQTIVDCLHYQK